MYALLCRNYELNVSSKNPTKHFIHLSPPVEMLLLVASGRWYTPAASHSLGSRTLMPRLHLLIHTGFPDNTSREAHYLSLQTKKRIMAILLVQQ